MGNSIGNKTTFWSLVKDRITIPTLQRDYIYGAGTEKTELVLNNMLETFYNALQSDNSEETLDFVYGSRAKSGDFLPLDGQQRLTTLYLLHYYAALIAKRDEEFTTEDEKNEFDILSRFSYATRNTTIAFCNQLLIGKYKELKNIVSKAPEDGEKVISEYLKDLDEFRGSFHTDPSIMSMMYVLDRIHQKFKSMDTIWFRLIAENCPINFYLLDFGRFDLSDDLYNKMNSRGKPLTNFEIFKAKMHKQIKKWNESKADSIAIKLDTNWMQYIWETLSHTKDLKQVDIAYMWFLKNIFRFFDYIAGFNKQRYSVLDDACLISNMTSVIRVKALENIFDTFSNCSSKVPEGIVDDYRGFAKDCASGDMKLNRMLSLYAIYLGLFYKLEQDEYVFRYRHIRNLINNSSDNIREEYIFSLINDVTHVMQGKILRVDSQKMNANSWAEEKEKERNRAVWKSFFKYEDIDEINGSINAFAVGLNATNSITLDDPVFVNKMLTRLKKAAHFFNAKGLQEHDRRSALLSLGCYAMANQDKAPAYRYFGVIKSSWQNFTGYHRFDERNYIMNAIDNIDTSKDVHDLVGDVSNTKPENWRYYAIKYASQITVGYRSTDYGYMYFFGVDKDNPFDENKSYLDVAILQSSYYSGSYVAWKMLHRILEQKCGEKYHMFLHHLGGDQILLSKISSDAKLDIQSDGWHLIGIPVSLLTLAQIPYSHYTLQVDEALNEKGNIINHLQLCDCLISHEEGNDYIGECENVLEKLSKIYPSLLK